MIRKTPGDPMTQCSAGRDQHAGRRRSARRQRLAASLAVLAIVASGIGHGAPRLLDPDNPEDAVRLQQKLWCSLEEGQPALLWSQGSVYGRIPGERDRKLFDFQIWNARACSNVRDPKRGLGYRSVSREIMLYIDPATGQLLRQWRNPFTGETVNVIHTQNDPVNMAAPLFAYDTEGKPYKFEATFAEGRVIASNEAPLFYDNPLGGAFQEYVGGRYHAMEMLNVFVYEKDLLDPAVKTLTRWSRSWKRVSGFLPWMRMGDRPGSLVFTAVGQRVQSVDQLPEPIRTALRTEFAKYQTPPPLDDPRPNETSWTYFKRVFAAEKSSQRGDAAGAPAMEATPAAAAAPAPAAALAAAAAGLETRDFAYEYARDCPAAAGGALTTQWRGRVYSRRAGEKDRHLLDLRRTRTARCELLSSTVQGRGYRVTAAESMDYLAPGGAEPLQEWTNPWTGEQVKVVGVRLDPAPAIEVWERRSDGTPSTRETRFVLTDKLLIGSDADAQFIKNPLGGEYQDFIGGQLQILDYTTTETPLALARQRAAAYERRVKAPATAATRSTTVPARDTVLSWGQVTPWLPWMKMGSRQGELVIHAAAVQKEGP